MHSLYIPTQASRQLTNTNLASALQLGEHRPAARCEAREKRTRGLEVQCLALILALLDSLRRNDASLAKRGLPVASCGDSQFSFHGHFLRFSTSTMKSSISRSTPKNS